MDMIKKTRYKFTAITLAAISLVLILILGFLNLCVYMSIYTTGRDNLNEIRARRGFIYDFSSPLINDGDSIPSISSVPENAPFIYVRLNKNTGSPFMTTNMSDIYSSNEIFYIAERLLETGKEKGTYNNMMYDVTSDGLNIIVTAVDVSGDLSLFHSLVKVSIFVILFSVIFVFIFSYYLSKWAIKPVEVSFDNQKRFISDASHELKTPLAVISANADVLETEIGENIWLKNIKNQSALMTDLVYDLLDLAKLDEIKDSLPMKTFDLSGAVLNKTLEFECTAFENHRELKEDIDENISFTGNEDAIKHLISILIDNAIKHSDKNGVVEVSLKSTGNRKILSVYNTGNGIKDSEKDKIFNRFYRSDQSRSKETGGYGLGLSIAKTIVETHKGKIYVEGEEGKWIKFIVEFKN